jgi:hypothetical protein
VEIQPLTIWHFSVELDVYAMLVLTGIEELAPSSWVVPSYIRTVATNASQVEQTGEIKQLLLYDHGHSIS